MSITSPDQLAIIRPIDIRDQRHFNELLASIPRPVPPEWKVQYGRLHAIAQRHGYTWPYAVRVSNPRVTGRPRSEVARPLAAAPLAPGTTIPYKGGIIEAMPRTQSAWHVAERDGWEYFYVDGYPKRAPLDSPIDPEEHCRLEGMEDACPHGEWPALYKELTGEKYPW